MHYQLIQSYNQKGLVKLLNTLGTDFLTGDQIVAYLEDCTKHMANNSLLGEDVKAHGLEIELGGTDATGRVQSVRYDHDDFNWEDFYMEDE